MSDASTAPAAALDTAGSLSDSMTGEGVQRNADPLATSPVPADCVECGRTFGWCSHTNYRVGR
jgi:hypothetical protein